MKFRTEIEIRPGAFRLDYRNRLLMLGSCFAETIAARLAAAKFRLTANPTGILFNPRSIASALRDFAGRRQLSPDELHEGPEGWFSFDFHGSFSRPTRDEALGVMNGALRRGSEALDEADRLIVTFGSARIYERNGRTVANCHKQPAREFRSRLLEIDEIVDEWSALLAGPLRGREVLLTVSPVRHTADGLEGNCLSKAVLRVAAARLVERHPAVHYFPAFEILTDDLRDYRFYADDLVHPSPAAAEYVGEKFFEAVCDEEVRRRIGRTLEIAAAAAHRPLHPHSEAHRAFCRQQIAAIAALPGADFRREEELFRSYLPESER